MKKQENILTINCGSSSIKYAIYQMPLKKLIKKGKIENIGEIKSTRTQTENSKTIEKKLNLKNHEEAIQQLIDETQKSTQVDRVGHRVVHGGEQFQKTTKINPELIKAIDENSIFAPLHNPENKKGILLFQNALPNIPQYAIFDTAFHRTIPETNYLYAIPKKYYQNQKIRKYGFHGISQQYIIKTIKENKELSSKYSKKNSKIISCHIGNGASITAIQGGKSIENSMGLSTLGGVIMGTRSGDIDPEIIKIRIEKNNYSLQDIQNILYKKSGIKAIYEKTSNMKIIIDNYLKNNPEAKKTITMFTNSIIKYIGAYQALMNGVDLIVLTGGTMEGSTIEHQTIREILCKKLKFLGTEINLKVNKKNITSYQIISKKNNSPAIIVIPTDEELIIAQETYHTK